LFRSKGWRSRLEAGESGPSLFRSKGWRSRLEAGEPGPSSSVNIPAVIDREEVLHVARLARLKLEDGEVEPMARELSAVLDHIARIAELDLGEVPPTAHVVEVTGRLRPDEPRPCLPREVALEQAPAVADNGFLVPSPQA
jgi:aspartyl-tRNA(Asn)/glutamyl-tRNA(Gln) amidotransferase subunit C